MTSVKFLAFIPYIAIIVGVFFVNRVTPIILGMPFLLFWCVMWLILSSVIMAIIYKNDPANKEGDVK